MGRKAISLEKGFGGEKFAPFSEDFVLQSFIHELLTILFGKSVYPNDLSFCLNFPGGRWHSGTPPLKCNLPPSQPVCLVSLNKHHRARQAQL